MYSSILLSTEQNNIVTLNTSKDFIWITEFDETMRVENIELLHFSMTMTNLNVTINNVVK